MNAEWPRFLSQRPMPFWGMLGAGLLLALTLAETAWRFWPGRSEAAVPMPPVLRPSAARTSDVQRLIQAHLFGQTEAPPVKVTVAPDTRLRLRLVGVVASSDTGQARAMIATDAAGKARSVAIGRPIAGTDAVLHAIEESRVLIRRGGVIEQLKLERKPRDVSSTGAALRDLPAAAPVAEQAPAPDVSPFGGGIPGKAEAKKEEVADEEVEPETDEDTEAGEEAEAGENEKTPPPPRAPARK